MTTTMERPGSAFQTTLDTFIHEPDDVWLIPASGGYSVRVGVDNKNAIGFIAPVPEKDGLWRVTRLDLFDDVYPSPSAAALALVTRTSNYDRETGEVESAR